MEDLEHGEIKLQLDNLNHLLSNSVKSLTIDIKESNNIALKTLEQTKKTNGRVTKLEEVVEDNSIKVNEEITALKLDTEVIRLIRRHKWLLAVFFLAFTAIFKTLTSDWFVTKLTNLFF